MKQQGEQTVQGHVRRAQTDTLGLRASDTEAIEAFRAVEWVDEETVGNLLDCLKESVGATGVYMAKYEEQMALKDGSTNPVLRYIATDKSHTHMLGQCLREVMSSPVCFHIVFSTLVHARLILESMWAEQYSRSQTHNNGVCAQHSSS